MADDGSHGARLLEMGEKEEEKGPRCEVSPEVYITHLDQCFCFPKRTDWLCMHFSAQARRVQVRSPEGLPRGGE